LEKLPESVHPKTRVGTIVHSILEALQKPRHRKHYDKIKKEQSIWNDKAIVKIVLAIKINMIFQKS